MKLQSQHFLLNLTEDPGCWSGQDFEHTTQLWHASPQLNQLSQPVGGYFHICVKILRLRRQLHYKYTLLCKSYDSDFHQNVLLCFQMTAEKLKPK